MRRFKSIACLLTVVVLMLCSFVFPVNAALFAFETQFDYKKANNAWLTDLVAKESMSELEQLASRLTLEAMPDYPYTATPESLKNDVAYYCTVYNLDEDSLRAAYIYIFQMMGDYSYLIEAETSDEQIKEYLISRGIVYPEVADGDTLILARAFYVAMVTGAFDAYIDESSLSGVQLEKAIIDYASVICGIDTSTLSKWIDSGNILSLDDYVLATARLSLWTNGYTVTPQTPAEEVYRQLAIMVIEEQGISASGELTTEELKVRYLAAMLSKTYDVRVDSDKLSEAVKAGSVPYYILQLLGQQVGLSIRSESYSYEDAFYLVADNSDVFSIESGEFYADIFEYNVRLKYIRDSIWLYPTSYSGAKEAQFVTVKVDGKVIKDSFYNEISLDSSLSMQTLSISVRYSTHSETNECVYLLNVYQGNQAAPQQETTTPIGDGADSTPDSASSIVNGILASLGVLGGMEDSIGSAIGSFPSSITNVLSVLTPSFEEPTTSVSLVDIGSDVFTSLFSVIDTIGEHVDFDLSGIGGFSLLSLMNNKEEEKIDEVDFLEVSFDEYDVVPPNEIEIPVIPGSIGDSLTEQDDTEETIPPATVGGSVSPQEESSSYNVSDVDSSKDSDGSSALKSVLVCLFVVAAIAAIATVVLVVTRRKR